LPGRVDAWLRSRKKELPSLWSLVEPVKAHSAGGATFTRLPDGSLLAGGKNPAFDTCTFVVHTRVQGIRAVRLEALAHPGMARGAGAELAGPVGFAGGTVLTFTLKFSNNTGHNIGRPRLSISTSAAAPAVAGGALPEDVRALLARLDGKPGTATPAEKATL